MRPARLLALLVGSAAGAVVASAPVLARAGEGQLEVGGGAWASGWPDGAVPWSMLRLGYRFADRVSIDGVGRLGYGKVDERLLAYFSLGASIWGQLGETRPFARLLIVHQHEEPRQAIVASPLESLLGTGDGIRHRAGGTVAAGLMVPFYRSGKITLSAGGEANLTGFLDGKQRGPGYYAGGGLSLGLDYEL